MTIIRYFTPIIMRGRGEARKVTCEICGKPFWIKHSKMKVFTCSTACSKKRSKIKVKEWVDEHQDRVRELQAKWRNENRERYNANQLANYHKNKKLTRPG